MLQELASKFLVYSIAFGRGGWEGNQILRYRFSFTVMRKILTACSCHVTYAFQSDSTLFSCLNVKNSLLEAGAKSEI